MGDDWTNNGISWANPNAEPKIGPHSAHWYETSQDEWDGRLMYMGSSSSDRSHERARWPWDHNNVYRQIDGTDWHPGGRGGHNSEEGIHTRPYMWRTQDMGW